METSNFKEAIFKVLKAWYPTAVNMAVYKPKHQGTYEYQGLRCYIVDENGTKADVTRDFWYICFELTIRSIEQEESCNQCEQ